MFKVSVLVFIISVLPILTSAQSILLDEGKSGYSISAFVDAGEEHSTSGSTIGYSWKGIIDLGFGYGKRTSWDRYGKELDGNYYEPYVSFALFRESECNPYAFTLGYSISFVQYRFWDAEDQWLKSNEHIYTLSMDLYRKINLGKYWNLIPSIGVSNRSNSFKRDNPNHGYSLTVDNDSSWELGLTVTAKVFKNLTIYFQPIVSSRGSEASLLTALGVVW